MTITLDNVPALVGIPVLIVLRADRPGRLTNAKGMLVSLLGVPPRDAHDELGLVHGTSVRLEWLRSKLSHITDADSRRRI